MQKKSKASKAKKGKVKKAPMPRGPGNVGMKLMKPLDTSNTGFKMKKF